jgi:co-chaperonin GroES (HSP10)
MATTPTVFSPLHDIVLVREIDREQFHGKIYVPPSSVGQASPVVGEVVAAGPDAEGIEPGDKVVYGKDASQPIDLDGEKGTFLIGYSNLAGKIE